MNFPTSDNKTSTPQEDANTTRAPFKAQAPGLTPALAAEWQHTSLQDASVPSGSVVVSPPGTVTDGAFYGAKIGKRAIIINNCQYDPEKVEPNLFLARTTHNRNPNAASVYPHSEAAYLSVDIGSTVTKSKKRNSIVKWLTFGLGGK